MAVEKIRLGTNEDGTPHYLYRSDKHLVYTGPNITGPVTLADGSTVDVTDLYTEADSVEQALEIADAVGARFADEGHPAQDPDQVFVHSPVALTHEADGTPSQAFADAVHELAPAGGDSSPAGVLATVQEV